MDFVKIQLEGFKLEVDACDEDTQCLNQMWLKIQRAFNDLPQEIQTAAQETILTLTNSKTTASNCGLEATNNLETDGKKIFDKIVFCVESKE